MSLLDHVEDSSGGTADHMDSHFQLSDVLLHGLTSETCMDLNVQVITECKGNFLGLFGKLTGRGEDKDLRGSDTEFDSLEGSKTEDGGFAGTGLGLDDDISGGNDGHYGPLLYGGGFIEA